MAFNFNWHPLTADSEFYSRAKDLLTTALNKSPKPPIIVSDILVSELNLGTTPPELEILEIGDLADDRFRGIFKMQYDGDAYLTLQTRVQANPLNTYLSTAPSFTNPQPLAASSPLTIPLTITLSEFRLSGFIILVFSKAKGITLVFRNDPLEKLKVSSTFDSIPFIKDYLQKEIETQLRNLFQEELPAIIHRLSLQWWGNDFDSASSNTMRPSTQAKPQRTLTPRSSHENLSDPADSPTSSTSYSFGMDPESDSLSSKNLLRLATLMDSQRTLSLFTPSIRDAIFRAWATTSDRNDPTATPVSSASSNYSCDSPLGTRPGLVSMTSSLSLSGSSSSLGSNGRPVTRSSAHGKKKKTRVVNLRRAKTGLDDDTSSVGDSSAADSGDGTSIQDAIAEEDSGGEVTSPPGSPPTRSPPKSAARNSGSMRRKGLFNGTLELEGGASSQDAGQFLANRPNHRAGVAAGQGSVSVGYNPQDDAQQRDHPYASTAAPPSRHKRQSSTANLFANAPLSPEKPILTRQSRSTSSSSIAEKALMMKMAGEMARRLAEERALREKAEEMFAAERQRLHDSAGIPPPAYTQ